MDTDYGTDATVAEPYVNPEKQWMAWGIYALISLIVAFTAVIAGFDRGLLLGWAAGLMGAAILLVVRGR